MSTYKQIAGTTVKAYTTNPSDPQEGEMWYNQTTLKLRGVTALAAFSSGGSLSVGRHVLAGAGTQTSGLVFGGYTTTNVTSTEEYNGSGWGAGGDLNTARRGLGGCGTQTAGLAFGGYTTTKVTSTEEYDGSSWTTSPNSMSLARNDIGDNCGIQTAALAFGGETSTKVANTEEYDGTSWTAGGDLNTARADFAGAGTQTAGLGFAGNTPPKTAATEEYNGTAWTSVNSMNTARTSLSGGGLQTSAIAMGGLTPSASDATELYDGTTWTTSPATMATARGNTAASAANNTAALVCGGPSQTTSTEEFNLSAQVITAAAWSSGGNLGTARQRAGGFGNAQNSAVVAAGATAPPASALSATEEYDGSAWSSGGSVNTARFNMTAFGTETAGVLSGKGTPSVPYGGTTEEYDGSSWTTVNPYAAPGANYRSSCGPQTAGLLAGGVAPAPAELTNAVEEYDGTNWTSGTNLPQFQSFNLQAGTQTAAINAAGAKGPAAPGPVTNNDISLQYDGTNWTSGPNANILPTQVRSYNGGTGTQTAAMLVGGETNTVSVRWDGTTFATDASYPTARGETSAAGLAPAPNAILFAGYSTTALNTTVEYSEESTSVNSVDITTAE